jgi:hypothetical protein
VKAKVLKIDQSIAEPQQADNAIPFTFNVWLELQRDPALNMQFVKGMNGYCKFEQPFQALAIPEKALIKYSGQRGLVMVVNSDQRIDLKPVSFTASIEGMVAISAGLTSQDRVILSGQIGLKAGDKVSVKAS